MCRACRGWPRSPMKRGTLLACQHATRHDTARHSKAGTGQGRAGRKTIASIITAPHPRPTHLHDEHDISARGGKWSAAGRAIPVGRDEGGNGQERPVGAYIAQGRQARVLATTQVHDHPPSTPPVSGGKCSRWGLGGAWLQTSLQAHSRTAMQAHCARAYCFARHAPFLKPQAAAGMHRHELASSQESMLRGQAEGNAVS